MKYCVNCKMNLGDSTELIEKEGNTYCPNCETEMLEITSSKLEGILTMINEAFYNLNETSAKSNAQEIIKNAKALENGEKKIRVQYRKKQREIKQLQYELEVIKTISEKVNYKLEK